MAVPKFQLTAKYKPQMGDFLVLPYRNRKKACFPGALLPAAIRRVASAAREAGGVKTVFSGKIGAALISARTVRLDAEHSTPLVEAKKMVSTALADAKKENAKRVVAFFSSNLTDLIAGAHEGALLGGYSFDRYLSKKPRPIPVHLATDSKDLATLRADLASRTTLFECVNFARDVLNEPPNVIKPPSLADAFKETGRASGLKITVWDEKRLEQENCGGIVAVGQGAKAKPRLVIGEYAPAGAKKHLCLVGKGVTFDTGGYGLKPSDAQVGMKYDMGGAAMVFGAACAIARLKLPIRITVITPLVENAVSGESYYTTSIIKTRAGHTTEVQHTDAEGRLILTDALTIAGEGKPDWIVDAATLTGACVAALGQDIAGVYGTDSTFTRMLIDAGAKEGELFWELPLHMPYDEQLKTTAADCKNIGGKYAGSITAALFLKRWVRKGAKWIHCDIAGPGTKEDPMGHLGKGAKGFGVKSLAALAQTLADKK
jgi:leucyl aminopeptidase